MTRVAPLAAAVAAVLAGATPALASPRTCDPAAEQLAVTVTPDPVARAAPRMGDRLVFHSMVANHRTVAAPGVVVWLTLLRLDAGHEQAMDLEDWSADKALSLDQLPSATVARRKWTLRLISPGTYRVLVSAATRDAPVPAIAASEVFTVASKSVVESARVLPVALGIPLVLGGLMALRLGTGQRTGADDG